MRRALALTALLAAAACSGGGSTTEALVVVDGFAVVDAWVRPTPATADEAAIYMTIENRDAPDDRLIAASSPRCMIVTPHLTMFDEDNITSMSEADADQLGITTGGRLTLEPNGLHLMCLGIADPFVTGETFEVTLEFAGHGPVTTPVVVEQR